jgi:uncharacterized protein (DUF2336 family)
MSIVTMRTRLTDGDIRTLVKGVTEEDRAQAAHKICRCIEDAELAPEERAHAEKIMLIMAQDAAVLVRRALAVALKSSPNLPRDLANKLATDIDTIALPVIMNSPALTDSDLVATAGVSAIQAGGGRQSRDAVDDRHRRDRRPCRSRGRRTRAGQRQRCVRCGGSRQCA